LKVRNGVTPLLELAYGYDKVANLLAITDSTSPSKGYGRTMTYDDFDRIKTDNLESITYERVGDIKTKTSAVNGASSTFVYDTAATKRLQSISGGTNRTFAYDTYGNTSSDGRFSYGYDAFNSLRSVNGNLVTYDYDANQHLAKKVANGVTTHYLYGKSGRLFAEYNVTNNSSKEFFYLGNKLVGQNATQP
jgi:hypothetical protein